MKPVPLSRAGLVMKGMPESDVGDLPFTRCTEEPDCVVTHWDLDPTERIAIAEGAMVEVHTRVRFQQGFPPMMLRVSTKPREV